MDEAVTNAITKGVFKQLTRATESLLECVVCNVQFTGSVPAAAHLVGSKHLKRTKNAYIDPGALVHLLDNLEVPCNGTTVCCSTPQKTSASSSMAGSPHSEAGAAEELAAAFASGLITQTTIGSNLQMFECIACHVPLTGDAPILQHMRGRQHAKAAAKRQLDASFTVPESPQRDTVSSTPSNVDAQCVAVDATVTAALAAGVLRVSGNSELFECLVCPAMGLMAGNVTAASHLAGKPHFKMLSCNSIELPSRLSAAVTSSLTSQLPDCVAASLPAATRNDDAFSHAVSAGLLVKYQRIPGVDSYQCRVCAVTMTGCVSAVEHVTGGKHLTTVNTKLMATASFAERCHVSPPKTTTVAPLRSTSPDSTISLDGALSSGTVVQCGVVLRCQVCRIACRSDVDMTQHIASAAHRQLVESQTKSTPEVLATPLAHSEKLAQCPELQQLVTSGVVELSLINGVTETYLCVVCDVTSCSVNALRQHVIGHKHLHAVEREKGQSTNSSDEAQRSDAANNVPSTTTSAATPRKTQQNGAAMRTSHVTLNTDQVVVVGLNEPLPQLHF